MTQTSQLVFARQQHSLEGRGSHDTPTPGRRLGAIALAGLTLGLLVGLAFGLPWGLGAAEQHGPAARALPPNGPGQSGEGIRCSGPATPGGTIKVEVGTNDDSVAVTNPVTGETTHHDVGPDKNGE